MSMLSLGQEFEGFRVNMYKETAREGEESYLVSNESQAAVLKIYDLEKLPRAAVGRNGELPVERLCADAGCADAYHVLACDKWADGGKDCRYVIRQFVSGQRMSDLLEQGKRYSWEEAVPVVLQVTERLRRLHKLDVPLIHNDVTPRNVILADDGTVALIGFGHLSYRTNGAPSFPTGDLNPWYRAPETYIGIYDEQSDVFSVGVLLYAMLFGHAPWQTDIPENATLAQRKKCVRDARRAPLDLTEGDFLADAQVRLLKKVLSLDYDNRFPNMESLRSALEGKKPVTEEPPVAKAEAAPRQKTTTKRETASKSDIRPRTGGGFADVAGMDDVKRIFYKDVLFILKNKEKAEKYHLKTPNGALLYGPPGCGKTFFAEKFAQESGLNFMMVKASDLGSIYIHGTQGKIADLFAEAEKKAPSVLCFDEFDAMVPNRSKSASEELSGEVNEFLTQLNNCSERGIFVIGTSNRPDRIDPAVLRTGRIDRLIYIPLPDFEARCKLFELALKGRYCADDVDCSELAGRTEGCVASDITRLVDDVALEAAMTDVPISQTLLSEGVKSMRRSVTDDQVKDFARMRDKLESVSRDDRKRIGFAAY